MRLDWTERAIGDLQHIDQWLTSEASPDVAEATLNKIRFKARSLRTFPRRSAVFVEDQRSIRVEGTAYRLIFRVTDDRVEILRIRHDREDWINRN